MKSKEETARNVHIDYPNYTPRDYFLRGVDFAEQFISVEDEMPEKYVNVFVIVKSSNSIFSCYLTDDNKFVGDDFPIEDYIEMDVCKWKPINRK